MDEKRLRQKLQKVEALYAGARTAGEKDAAERAKLRLLARLARLPRADPPPPEYRFTMKDVWSRRLFVAVLRRHGISSYRYKRQRRTTVMARIDRRLVEAVVWPEFRRLSRRLDARLAAVTEGFLDEVF